MEGVTSLGARPQTIIKLPRAGVSIFPLATLWWYSAQHVGFLCHLFKMPKSPSIGSRGKPLTLLFVWVTDTKHLSTETPDL